MKRGLYLSLVAGLFLAVAQIRADTLVVFWNFDDGFSPATLTINSGDTVIWYDDDLDDFQVQITSDLAPSHPNYFNFFLSGTDDFDGRSFTNTGTVNYHDGYGNNATLTIDPALPPTTILLSAARMSGGQFLFDATGLEVGGIVVVESSSNLTSWIGVETNLVENSSMTFTNPAAAGSWFYRVYEVF